MTLLMRPEPFTAEFDRLADTLFGQAANASRGARRWTPPMDLVEADDHFSLRADLPGMGEEDVSIEVQDNVLTISGERATEHEAKERGWFRVERTFGRFSRSLTLPDGVDPGAIAAAFDRGVLEVRIPKPEERKPRRVEIKARGANGRAPAIEGTASEKK